MELTLDQINKFLEKLGFEKDSQGNYIKRYSKHNNYKIKVEINFRDLKKSLIYYNPDRKTTDESNPEPTGFILLGDLTTSNFENSENFVVLEAVNRLLEIGYKPENIHLERKWKLGRTGKSGKADITVYESSAKPQELTNESHERETFMIIECKTWGDEFEEEKRRLFKNGGQLFSYFQQDRSTKILALYTSIFEENEITYDSVIIKVEDDENLVKKCQEKTPEDIPCSFKEAPDVSSLVDVWKRVYNQYIFKHGIFEFDAQAYSLDLKPLKKKDLILLKSSQGLFNAFAEILRHNNISDNANAFNKMLSLFLCKIVDEETKDDEEVLDFQIKLGETFEEVVDRLQKLYQIGMKKYLGVDNFVYYSDDDIRRIIELYPRRSKLEDIEKIFKEIKYYTNNEFAFKEVHNKELFYQNALILSEVIELLQIYQIKYSHKNQILGDFFELLLNHGVKQSEGQFFTPIPIVRFMIISVALDKYIEKKIREQGNEEGEEEPLPKILDYACGAAHFLTEAIDEINKVIETRGIKIKKPWEGRYIFGIEKDYRLARTAKIACFLNGDGSANIIFGDGLDDYPDLQLDKEKFDFVLTNPPYSVKKFKNYLDVRPRYELLQYLTENSSEIEVLFVERAKQVLKEGGRAAIILPSSILSTTGIYSKTRELILKNFEIKGIAEFGSQTFIATGTNVVILFLERRGEWFYEDRQSIADEIYNEKVIKKNDYVDIEKLFDKFIQYRSLPKEDYKKFVFEDVITDKLANTEIFQSYKGWFDNLAEIRNLRKKKSFKSLSEEEKKEKLEELFKRKVREIEKEKFFYFSLLLKRGQKYGDTKWYDFQKVVIARAPSKTDEQKQYLGYEFNKRRGFEGIEIYRDGNGEPTTKLYDNKNYYNPQKIASYIRKNFEEEEIVEIDEEVKPFLDICDLPDLLNFERVDFEKQINLAVKKKVIVEKEWKMEKLKNIAVIIAGQSPESTFYNGDGNGLPFYQGKKDFGKKYLKPPSVWTTKVTKESYKDDVLISVRAPVGDVNVNPFDKICIGRGLAAIRATEKILPKYLFEILRNFKVRGKQGATFDSISVQDLGETEIPVLPLEIQQQIVSEIEILEQEEEDNDQKIEKHKKEIEEITREIFNSEGRKRKIENLLVSVKSDITKVKKASWKENGDIPVISQEEEVLISGYVDKENYEPITDVPLIVFGDHTCAFKYVNFPFVVGADGVVLMKFNEKEIDSEYAFFILNALKEYIPNRGKYERHFKYLKQLEIPILPLEIQREIASQIKNIEKEIEKLQKRNEETEKEKGEILKKYLHVF